MSKAKRGPFQVPAVASNDGRLNPTDKLILEKLCKRARSHGSLRGWCWVSNGSIAREAGLATRTVRRSVSKLEDLGYLVRRAFVYVRGHRIETIPDEYADAGTRIYRARHTVMTGIVQGAANLDVPEWARPYEAKAYEWRRSSPKTRGPMPDPDSGIGVSGYTTSGLTLGHQWPNRYTSGDPLSMNNIGGDQRSSPPTVECGEDRATGPALSGADPTPGQPGGEVDEWVAPEWDDDDPSSPAAITAMLDAGGLG